MKCSASLIISLLVYGLPAAAQQPVVKYDGFVDVCRKSLIMGWAKNGKLAVPVTLVVNGRTVATIKPNMPRNDVVKDYPGTDLNTGFRYDTTTVELNDRVEVKFPNGSNLAGSPCKVIP